MGADACDPTKHILYRCGETMIQNSEVPHKTEGRFRTASALELRSKTF